jgi:hypothetical protein
MLQPPDKALFWQLKTAYVTEDDKFMVDSLGNSLPQMCVAGFQNSFSWKS